MSYTTVSFDKRQGSSSKDNGRNATMEGVVQTSFSNSPFSKKMKRSCDTPDTFVSHEVEVSLSFVPLRVEKSHMEASILRLTDWKRYLLG